MVSGLSNACLRAVTWARLRVSGVQPIRNPSNWEENGRGAPQQMAQCEQPCDDVPTHRHLKVRFSGPFETRVPITSLDAVNGLRNSMMDFRRSGSLGMAERDKKKKKCCLLRGNVRKRNRRGNVFQSKKMSSIQSTVYTFQISALGLRPRVQIPRKLPHTVRAQSVLSIMESCGLDTRFVDTYDTYDTVHKTNDSLTTGAHTECAKEHTHVTCPCDIYSS